MLALSAVVIPVGIYLFVSGRNDELAAQLPERKNWMWPLFWFMTGAAVVSVILLRSGWLHGAHGQTQRTRSRRSPASRNRAPKDEKVASASTGGP